MRKRIKTSKTDNLVDLVSFLKYVRYEIAAILLLATIRFWFGNPFTLCLKDGVMKTCLIAMIIFGMSLIAYLVDNDWRVKRANQEYPVYMTIVLLIMNAVFLLLVMWLEGRGLFLLGIPMGCWLIQIPISTYHKWSRRGR